MTFGALDGGDHATTQKGKYALLTAIQFSTIAAPPTLPMSLTTNDDRRLRVEAVVDGVASLIVTNAIDQTAFDLNAAPFSATSAITNDYILNSIKLNFSTVESKTITVTGPDGTIIYQDTNINQSVSLEDINIAFNASENFTVAVTQFGAAGTMDCIAVVKEGSSTLGGNPVLAPTSQTRITDGTDILDVFGDGDELDLQDPDLTVGTSKGLIWFAKDPSDTARYLNLGGFLNKELKVTEGNSYFLKEILTQLKVNGAYLREIVGEQLTELDLEE